MIDLKFVNSKGDIMPAVQNQYMTLIDAEELHGVDNEFASSTSPYFDGDYVDHVRTNPRNITLTYALKTPIEESLKYFNSLVKSKQKATLIEIREDGSEISIEGLITVPPYTRWVESTSIQIQLYCSKPYWSDLETIIEDIGLVLDMHYFPFEDVTALQNLDGGLAFPEEGIPFGEIDTNMTKGFTNNGDVSVGMTIEIVALGEVENPRISLVGSTDYITVNTKLNSGDFIIINTEKGNKSIQKNGVEVYDEIEYGGDDWLQLPTGYSELTITATSGSGNMYFNVYYKQGWQ